MGLVVAALADGPLGGKVLAHLPRFLVARVDLQRPLVAVEGLVVLLAVGIELSQDLRRLHILGVELGHHLERRFRALQMAQGEQRVTEAMVELGIAVIAAQGALAQAHRPAGGLEQAGAAESDQRREVEHDPLDHRGITLLVLPEGREADPGAGLPAVRVDVPGSAGRGRWPGRSSCA